MITAEDLRVGWCPGVLRPTMAGDGLLIRIKPRGGRVAVETCRALAALSMRHGNGLLTITGRGNIQLRGVAEADLAMLTAALGELGLLDATAEGEAARNLVSSPLAGCDPTALLDIRPIAAALEDALTSDPRFARLPAKFAWILDDGGALGLASVQADVRFTATAGPGGAGFVVALGGADDVTSTCSPEDVLAAASSLAEAFLAQCAAAGVPPHRMADLTTGACGARVVFARAGLPCVVVPKVTRATDAPSIGLAGHGTSSRVGVAPPFGRLEAASLDTYATIAGQAGSPEVRFTPWRTMMIAGLAVEAASAVLAAVATHGPLITDPADPRLAIAACAGAPACRRATVQVQEDAARLAPLLGSEPGGGIALHMSGCAKGCAHGAVAPMTLVGREGRYDLVRHGKAGDRPALRDLSVEALASLPEFAQIAASPDRPAAHREPVC